MAIASIQRYLKQAAHNYQEGRVLFERYSNDSVLTLLFRSGSSSYHHRKLMAALEELADQEEVSPSALPRDQQLVKPAVPKLEQFDIPVKKTIDDGYHSMPERIQEVIRKKNMHHRRALQLYVEIGLTEDRERRLEMALALLEDHQIVNECWGIIDDYKETGKILVEQVPTLEEEVNALTLADLIKSSKNLASNISKDKKKLSEMPDGSKKAKVLLRYQSNQLRQDMVRKRLDNLTKEASDE